MSAFNRRLIRLENPSGNGIPTNLAELIDNARMRQRSDPEGAARDAEARFQALVAREANGQLRELERAILAGLRRARASTITPLIQGAT